MRSLLARIDNRTKAVSALALAALAGFVLLVAGSGGGDQEAAAQDSGTPTVALERRDLAEKISVDGTLGYGDEAAVVNRLSGTITWLPEEGAEIRRGRTLFDVDNEPVILMYGDVPAYRELSSGVADGPDIKQLEANLAELGFDAEGSMTVDDEYTSATSEAVSDWQESSGLDETGSVELGRVIFQAGARRVGTLEVELGSSADSASSGTSGVSSSAGATSTVLASYTTGSVTEVAPTQTTDEKPDQPAGGGENDKGSKGENPGSGGKGKGKGQTGGEAESPQAGATDQTPAQSGATSGGAGAGGGTTMDSGGASEEASSPSTQVMTTSSTERAVTVELDPEQVDVAKRGENVQVTLPDGNEVKGRIATVGTVAEAAATDSESSEGQATEDATIQVTIRLSTGKAAGALDEAPVTVDFTESVQEDVFAVPVAALIGTAGDAYAVVVRDGDESRQVAVEPGLFADGYVEISGDGLEEGMEVEVPEE
ncbi:MAG: peptidoglycan-binding protein [Solirubrobacterales bacterium]